MTEIYTDSRTMSLEQFMAKSFLWMALGLAVTAVVAFATLTSGLWITIFSFSYAPLVLLVAEVGVVIYLSGRLSKMSVTTARIMFLIYSAINGLTFSILPLIFGMDSIFMAFGFTSILFVTLAVIGLTMKKDLSRYGNLLLAGLITLIAMSFIGYFMNISSMAMFINYGGVILFLCITAYDVQKMRSYYYNTNYDGMLDKLSIYSALDLYLDFINIFIYVLRILGKRSN